MMLGGATMSRGEVLEFRDPPAAACASYERIENRRGRMAEPGRFVRVSRNYLSISRDLRDETVRWRKVGVAVSACGRFIEIDPALDDFKWPAVEGGHLTLAPANRKRVSAVLGERYPAQFFGGKLYFDFTRTLGS